MRGRRLVIDWQDDASTLAGLYRTEQVVELRTRWHALWLLRAGHSLAETAGLVGIHYKTLQQWVAWYRAGGVAEVRSHRKAGRQGRASKLTAEQLSALRAKTATGVFHTASQARAWVCSEFGVTYTPKSIYGVLARLKLHPKVPRPQAIKADPLAQAEWKKGGSQANSGRKE